MGEVVEAADEAVVDQPMAKVAPKNKTKSKENQKSKFASRKKEINEKTQKVEQPSSLVIFPNILTKEKIFYFKINSVKSKRKKKISKNIKQATSVLKRKKKVFVISQQK